MQCTSCHHDNPAGQKFCGECGGRLPTPCPACQTPNPVGQKFCGECGGPLAAGTPQGQAPSTPSSPPPGPAAAAASSSAPADRFASPASYTPKHLAEKILTSRSAVEGERKQVTVMFTDVSGFTTMSERLDPEDVHAIIDRAFEVMLEAVHRYEGTINQFLGDGIMALFGAPIAHEDHAHRALCAALAIRGGLEPLQADVRRTHGVDFRLRTGLNTGLVVVGAIGRDLRMDYTAVGDTTNVAARLMSLAQPGQIVVSRPTQYLRERFFRWEDLGDHQLKGKAEPVHAYALLDEIRGRTRLEVSRERGLTPLIGRETEVEALLAAYRAAEQGQGAVVEIRGEPGVGKSRLLYEFSTAVEATGCLELEASCVAYGRQIPYRPILELMRSYLGLLEDMTDDEVRSRVDKCLLALEIDDGDAGVLLAHFLGVAAPEAFLNRLGAAQLKDRTFAVVRNVFGRASETTPLVLVVENIHWIDTSSEEFLGFLANHVPERRIVLLVTTRPGGSPSALAERASLRLALEGLGADHIRRMASTLTQAATVSDDLSAMLLEKSAGNPLYVEEILRQLMETNGLEIVDGEIRLGRSAVAVPETIHDIIAARVDRVSEELKRVLQGAAVIGRRFGVSLLSRVLGVPGDSIRHDLEELHRLDFIFPAAHDPELMYSFKHALTQDVVYGSVLERRRRTYHATAATGLEEFYADNRDAVVELIAYHFQRGHVWDKAAHNLRRAAVKAQARSAHREALASLEGALDALRHLPETPETREQEIDVRIDLRGSLYPLGEFDRMVTYLKEAGEMAQSISDSRRLGLVSIHTAEYFRQTGQFADARRLAEEALALGDKLQDLPLRLYASHYLGLACHALGEYRRAAEVLRAVVQSQRPDPARGGFGGMVIGSWEAFQAITLAWLARSLAELGEFDEGMDAGARAVSLAEDVGSPYSLAIACLGLGNAAVLRGHLEVATPVLERALGIARDAKLAILRPQATRLLGNGYLLAGRVDEGLAHVQSAADEVESRRLLMQHAVVLGMLAEALLAANRVDEAAAVAQRAVDVAHERGQRGDGVAGLLLLAESIARGAHAGDSAPQRYLDTIALAEELGMRPVVAHAHLGLGRLAARSGDLAGAEHHLLAATRLFIVMDMPLGVRDALAALQALGSVLIVSRAHRELYEYLTGQRVPATTLRIVLDAPEVETFDDRSRRHHVEAMAASHGMRLRRGE